jgi:hypothetical protein
MIDDRQKWWDGAKCMAMILLAAVALTATSQASSTLICHASVARLFTEKTLSAPEQGGQ